MTTIETVDWKEMAALNSRVSGIRAAALVRLIETAEDVLEMLPAYYRDDYDQPRALAAAIKDARKALPNPLYLDRGTA